jgi:uncharacterized membrane protein SpoIIM required for sporulation
MSGLVLSYCLSNTVNNIDEFKGHLVICFNMRVFFEIFFNNIFIGTLIAIFGFITGGGLSLIILFWNGMIIGELTKLYPIENIIKSVSFFFYHGIFEIIAILCFGLIGMKGLDFYVNLYKYNIIKIDFPINLFIFSLILLFIASVIETFLISTL